MNLHKANCQMSSMGWAASIPPECTCNSPSDAGVNDLICSNCGFNSAGHGLLISNPPQCPECKKVWNPQNHPEYPTMQPPPTESWERRFDERFTVEKGMFGINLEARMRPVRAKWVKDFIRTERESYQKELVERIQKNREMIPATNYEKNAQPFGGPEDYEKRGRHNALTEVLALIRSLN